MLKFYRCISSNTSRNRRGSDMASCNCRSKGECPLGGRCNSKNVGYLACLSPMESNNDGERVYIGISGGNWKQRLYNHRHFSPIYDLET